RGAGRSRRGAPRSRRGRTGRRPRHRRGCPRPRGRPVRASPRELVAQLREHPGVGRREARLGTLLAAELGELAQQLGLLLVDPGGDRDLDVHVQVATSPAVQVTDPETAQGLDVARLGPGAQVDLLGAVEGLDLDDRAERSGRHRYLERAVQVVTAAHERGVRLLTDLEVDVARGPARGADLALARELDAG